MDLATLIGYVLAWGALIYSMYHATHGKISAYLNPAELLLVMAARSARRWRRCRCIR